MTKRIFHNILLTSVMALLLTSALLVGTLYNVYEGRISAELRTEAEYIVRALDTMQDDLNFLRGLTPNNRITLISPDGIVLYDSAADEVRMDSHAERPEVSTALAEGTGQSRRYSDTLSDITTYLSVTTIRCTSAGFTIMQNMREGLVLIDKSDRIISINGSAMKVFGVKGIIAPDADLLTICRDTSVMEIVKEAQTGKSDDAVFVREDRTYRIFASPVLREEKVRGVVLLALDISAHFAAEASRREFTANVSHELKTPLTSISGYAEIIASGIAKSEDVPVFAEKIHAEAKRLVALVNDILDLSRLDERQGLGTKEPVALMSLINSLNEAFQPIAQEKGVALKVEGDHATIEGYPVLLRELFHNLIDNAVKYTLAGGSVTVCLTQEDGHTVCTVADTVIGIPAEHQAHVFERFYRVDKSHSRQTGGTGLGLAIVKHVVEVHHARVELKSAPGDGTTIKIIF